MKVTLIEDSGQCAAKIGLKLDETSVNVMK